MFDETFIYGPEIVASRTTGITDFAMAYWAAGDTPTGNSPGELWADGAAFIMSTQNNEVLRVGFDRKISSYAMIPGGPTSGVFGRTEVDKDVLYVVTSSGGVFKVGVKRGVPHPPTPPP
jgi:hypothetical protein